MRTVVKRSTGWRSEEFDTWAYLVTPNGQRVARMTKARARGIAAALNTPQGAQAFELARVGKPLPTWTTDEDRSRDTYLSRQHSSDCDIHAGAPCSC